MIFKNIKRQDLLVKVFILVKPIYMKLQSNLLENMVKFDNKSRSRLKEHKKKKEVLMKVHMLFTKVEN